MREAIFFSPPLDAIGSVTSITHNRARASRNHMQGGIKFFAGERTPDLETLSSIPIPVTAENLLNNHAVWWPEATIEAAHPFFKHGKVNVVGGPQSGKGTILFGLSEICETADWRYAFIDGHFQNTPAQEVVAAIRAAQQQGAVILFDSFDYLFAGSRRMRSISRANQSVRTETIIAALDQITVPLAITTHDQEWAAAFVDQKLRDQFSSFLDQFPVYRIPDTFQSPEAASKFLTDHGISEELAKTFFNLPSNPNFMSAITLTMRDGKRTHALISRACLEYPVLKELVRSQQEERFLDRGRREEFWPVLTALMGPSRKDEYVSAAQQVAQIIQEAKHKSTFLTNLRNRK